jgi:hypothetical protein
LNAFTVTVFVPSTSATFADHAAVPVAVPDEPVELPHVIEVASVDAVPLTVIVGAEVETTVNAGDVIFRAGGPPDDDAGFAGGAVGGGEPGVPGLDGVPGEVSLVTATTREAIVPASSTAVTVMMFMPRFSGTTGMFQIDVPLALPDGPWLFVHDTCGLPVPPVTVPDIVIEDVVTETAVAFGAVTETRRAGGCGAAVEVA